MGMWFKARKKKRGIAFMGFWGKLVKKYHRGGKKKRWGSRNIIVIVVERGARKRKGSSPRDHSPKSGHKSYLH